jgi:hypothetical protein
VAPAFTSYLRLFPRVIVESKSLPLRYLLGLRTHGVGISIIYEEYFRPITKPLSCNGNRVGPTVYPQEAKPFLDEYSVPVALVLQTRIATSFGMCAIPQDCVSSIVFMMSYLALQILMAEIQSLY